LATYCDLSDLSSAKTADSEVSVLELPDFNETSSSLFETKK